MYKYKKMKIFCLSIYNENYELFKKFGLDPVGLGSQNFDNKWLKDKGLNNISDKNKNFGEYTFHYYLWKNKINKEIYNDWIGFCTYRRFWIKKNFLEPKNIDNLEEAIIRKPDSSWEGYDVILVEPLVINKVKNIKLIKRNLIEVLKKPSVLFSKTSLRDQFNIFHGSYYLKEAIKLLKENDRSPFSDFLDGYSYNAFNMFICKNSSILNKFYEEIFQWLFKCEEIFQKEELKGYDKIRIYGFLAERYMPYWFKKNFKTLAWPIAFFDTHKLFSR